MAEIKRAVKSIIYAGYFRVDMHIEHAPLTPPGGASVT